MATIAVGNDKGGVGKDIAAEGIYLAARKNGLNPLLIEIEVEPRLSLLYTDAVYVPFGAPTPDDLYRNPDVIYKPLDEAMTRARTAELAIVCLGANVTQALQVWSAQAGARSFGDGKDLTFAILLTMSRGALTAGLTNLYQLGRLYPAARRVAVLNEVAADFIDGDANLAKRLDEARADGNTIETIKLRRMAAPCWGYLQAMGSLPDAAAATVDDLVGLGLPEGPSIRSLAMLERWIANDLVEPMSTLLPPTPASPTTSRKGRHRTPE